MCRTSTGEHVGERQRGRSEFACRPPSSRRGGAGPRPAVGPRQLAPGARSPRSHRSARGAGGDPTARPRADPVQPDGRLALRFLPRGGPADGRRPSPAATERHRRPAVRRRAPVQLRVVRVAGADRGVRHHGFRRDAARAVRMGPQAPRCEPRPCQPLARLLGARRSPRRPPRDPVVPNADGRVRDDARDRRLLRTGGRGLDPGRRGQARSTVPAGDRPFGVPPRRPPRAPQADRRGRGRSPADRRSSAGHHPSRRGDVRPASTMPWPATATPSRRTDVRSSIATRSRTSPSRSSASAASASPPSPCCWWATATLIHCSSR